MGRGRRRIVQGSPYYGHAKGIDHLEERVIFRSVQPRFTLDDVVSWLYPPDVIRLCKSAYPVVNATHRGASTTETLELPVMMAGMVECNLRLEFSPERLPMLVPMEGLARNDNALFQSLGIRDAMAEAVSIHLQCDKLRKVAEWAEKNLTPAAARDYVPWLGGVLPNLFDKVVEGNPYKEPAVAPDAEMLGYMREGGTIMASALLATPVTPEEDTARSNFAFSISKNEYLNSELFWLL